VMLGLNNGFFKRLPERIIAIQRTENMNVLVQLYNRALVMLTLSHNDTYPTTNLESLACGTPVITYPTGGSPEAIDENTGYIVEAGNFDAIIDAIRTIDKNGKSHYSAHCRVRAERLFNKDLQFAKYGELYKQVTEAACKKPLINEKKDTD
ncbi:MAG: glycosyltransferase, partial [Muribaculaceae bacterium]